MKTHILDHVFICEGLRFVFLLYISWKDYIEHLYKQKYWGNNCNRRAFVLFRRICVQLFDENEGGKTYIKYNSFILLRTNSEIRKTGAMKRYHRSAMGWFRACNHRHWKVQYVINVQMHLYIGLIRCMLTVGLARFSIGRSSQSSLTIGWPIL